MVTMILKSHDVDYKAFHLWMSENVSNWTIFIPPNQSRMAFSTPESSPASVEWLQESVRMTRALDSSIQPVRIHYRFKSHQDAMLAKLTWGELRQWGRSPKKEQAIAKTDGDSE